MLKDYSLNYMLWFYNQNMKLIFRARDNHIYFKLLETERWERTMIFIKNPNYHLTFKTFKKGSRNEKTGRQNGTVSKWTKIGYD